MPMDIYFTDPDAVPLPPNEINIQNLSAHPWADQQRVHVNLEITPFQKNPNAVITIHNQDGEEVASITIIETIEYNMEFTLHLRGSNKPGKYLVTADVYYEIPNDAAEQLDDLGPGTSKKIVDRAKYEFTIQ
jgi:hypothetical protein